MCFLLLFLLFLDFFVGFAEESLAAGVSPEPERHPFRSFSCLCLPHWKEARPFQNNFYLFLFNVFFLCFFFFFFFFVFFHCKSQQKAQNQFWSIHFRT
jgi:hypothetical protein